MGLKRSFVTRPALDVALPLRSDAALAQLEALLDDFQPFAIEESSPRARRVHFLTAAARDDALQAIGRELGDFGVSASSLDVDDEDWARQSQASLRAVRVGNIVVAPPWDVPGTGDRGSGVGGQRPNIEPASLAPSAQRLVPSSGPQSPVPNPRPPIVIVIEPSMGFGTGHHASTRLCLQLMQKLDLRGTSVLDIGTGSGILALAAHRLGASTVTAIDTDADAIDSAARNLAANGIAAGIDLRHGDIRTLEAPSADVVLANLTGAILVDQALRLMTMIKPDGHLVASGFTTDEEEAVSIALRPYGAVSSCELEGDWVALLLQVH